jgi:large subunit ribosomal protein L31
MKEKIHPNYVEATIVCACGNTWKTRSTRSSVHLDVCSRHPYFTGEQRIVDTAGRVERFRKRYEKAAPRGGR